VPLASNDIPASLAAITKPVKLGELVFGQFKSLLIVGSSIETIAPVAAHLLS
jgi:hypothetical protein